jgi:hypothetical protein
MKVNEADLRKVWENLADKLRTHFHLELKLEWHKGSKK